MQELYADAEDNYFTLMKLYELLSNSAAVEEQYWLLKKMLQEHLAVEPSEEVEVWYRRWKQANAIIQSVAFRVLFLTSNSLIFTWLILSRVGRNRTI